MVFLLILGPVVIAESTYRLDKIRGVTHSVPDIVTSDTESTNSGGFGTISPNTESITPVSIYFGIVIEKINANAKVVANVNPGNEKEYIKALSEGVAHAAGTSFPGENGNIYLFSHSTDAPWNIARFNAIFYLLRELEPGDRIVTFYQGKRYDYIVFDKVITSPDDVSYLTNKYAGSVLTLQTCDPPGTVFKRLLVRAKLAGS